MFLNPTSVTPYVVGLSVLFTLVAHSAIVVGLIFTLRRASIRDTALTPALQISLASLGLLVAAFFAIHLYLGESDGLYPSKSFPIHELSGTGMILFHFGLLAATQILWIPKARNELTLGIIGLLQLPNCYT